MGAPTVIVDDTTILLGTTKVATEIFTVFDPDGDVPTHIELRDQNNQVNSGYWTYNGIQLSPNVWHRYDYANVGLLVYHSGTVIGKENIQFRAEAAGQLGPVSDAYFYTVVENTTRPIVTGSDLSVVQNEYILVNEFFNANDPDGFPISRYKIFEANSGATSGYLELDGVQLAAGQWHYVEVDDMPRLRFYAALAAPNNDPIYLRAFDRNYGDGSNGQGKWSFPLMLNSFTTVNFNRPVVVPTEYVMATDETVALRELFVVTDADNNSPKRVRFWDTSPHSWSGTILENGVPIAANQWVEREFSELGNMEWLSASRSFNEQIRIQVFDGKHWSEIQTIRVATNEKPVIGVNEDYSIRQQLEFVDVSVLVEKLDDGPVYTGFEVYDATTDSLSGNFRLGATTLAPGIVHDLTPQDFFDLQFKSGVWDTRSVDELYVRAYNGTFWSDWTRHTVRTEPEYLDSLASGSWLNFRTQEDGVLPLTYSFMQLWPTYGTAGEAPEAEFISPWIEMRDLVRQAFLRIEELVDIDFEEVPDSINGPNGQGGDIRIGTYCVESPTIAYATMPGPEEVNGDLWFNRFHTGTPPFTNASDPPCGFGGPGFGLPLDNWDKGSPNYATFVHELGHALGLKHPFSGNPVLPPATNLGEFTAMSYSGTVYPEWDPELYDIAALQSIYGANMTHNITDTLYNSDYWPTSNFSSGAGGGFDRVDSIWDAGGWDIIDSSDQFTGGQIDLRPGAISSIGTGLTSIAFDVDIEEAIGSQFSDSLTGNDLENRLTGLGGDDILQGYGRDDFLSGGGGRDRYVYQQNDGFDTINEAAGAGRDTLAVGLFLGMDNFTEDLSFSKSGNNLEVNFTIDEGISRGMVTIENQGWGKYRVETLEVLGVDVDLKYLWGVLTSPNQQFALTSDVGQYGLLVSPV